MEVGIQQVNKMVKMITDIGTSKDVVKKLREAKGTSELGPGVEF